VTILTPSFELTPLDWSANGGRRPIEFAHRLVDEPLLGLDALAELADALGPDQIEVTGAAAARVVDKRVTRRRRADDEAGSELVLTAERDGRWMAMRHVETVPAYRRLVDGLFGEFCAHVGVDAGRAYRPEGYVFIGATGAVTPAHVDHEHNLFFQIRGTKVFTTGEFPDADREHRTFEGMYADEYGSTNFAPANPVAHVLAPGDGLYVPPPALHLVENRDALAVSFSLVFHDAELDRTAKVYALNAHLRSAGLTPRPPGRSGVADRAKALVVDGWRAGRQSLDRVRSRR
jgi:Cupin-like domain